MLGTALSCSTLLSADLRKTMATLRRGRALVSTLSRLLNSNPTSVAPHQTLPRPTVGSVYRFYSSIEGNKPLEIDLSNEESRRRLCNRLLYRSKQRGFLELDLVLGKWVEDHIHSMDENGIKSLNHILGLENPDLWKWLTGQEEPPEAVDRNPVFVAVREKVATNLENHAAPGTRAIPGQPWVRGWDDFKNGREGGPFVGGNQ